KGNQPIQKIGEKILIASSSITYVVDKLEKKNYLKRKPCPKDRRVTHATITEEGKNLMDEVFPKHRKDLKEIFGGLNIEEKEDKIKEEGKNLMDEVFPKHRKDLKEIFGGLNIEEKEDLIEKLKKLGFYAENK